MIDLPIKKIEFNQTIERLVTQHNISYLDAVIHWCETNGFDVEYAADLIKKNINLRSKIQTEAEDLKMLTPTTTRLPI